MPEHVIDTSDFVWTTPQEWNGVCPLCNHRMSVHTVMTEGFDYKGRPAIRPVGWRCPDA